MGRGKVVGVVCASGGMAVDAIASTSGRIAIGFGDEYAGDGSMTGEAA